VKTSLPIFVALVLTVCLAPNSRAGDLQSGTILAWDAYLKEADFQMKERAAGRRPFLWMDEVPARAARARRGEVVIAPAAGHGTEGVPGGLVHDWIGAIFIPGASVDALLTVVHDYDHYQRIYQPAVKSSKTLACTGERQEFQMVLQNKVLLISAAIEGRYQARDILVDEHRGYSIADMVQMREIEGYGRPSERLLPPDTGNGFLWRIRSMARFEERDGGLYLELEAIALTRDIPVSLAWMVNPAVNHLSIHSLTTTLRQTRDAVLSSEGILETSAARTARSRVARTTRGTPISATKVQ
jgi:hypothetical protein